MRTYKAVQADMPEAISNQFYVTELMEENVHCPELEEILAEYQKPVVWQDDLLGELTLDKRFSMFEGNFLWRGQAICISLEVDKEDEDSWTQAIKAMGQMSAEQDRWDKDMRGFAADKLTPLANDWQDDEDESKPDITEQDFARRIQLQTLSVDPDGSFSAYYDDDDMFWGHVVVVYGTLEGGITSAQMEG